ALTTLATSADPSVTKADTPDPVTAGNNITYTITVTNSGPSDAQSVVLTDPVPANTTFVSCAAPTGWACVNNAGTVTANRVTPLAAGSGPQIFTLVVTANASTPNGTIITNTATIASPSDTTTGNNTAMATTTVTAAATTIDVGVTKVDTPDPVTAGQNITYTITLTNSGTGTAAANS